MARSSQHIERANHIDVHDPMEFFHRMHTAFLDQTNPAFDDEQRQARQSPYIDVVASKCHTDASALNETVQFRVLLLNRFEHRFHLPVLCDIDGMEGDGRRVQ